MASNPSGTPHRDGRYGAFAGLRNDVDAERFETSDLEVATNVDIDKTGRLARRPGFTSVLAGAYHSLWSDNTLCLVVVDGALKKLSAAYVPTTLKTLSNASAWMSYSKINDRVYFANGTDIGLIENGTARTWGIAPPPPAGVTQTVGLLSAGTYQYTMTYHRADGQESGAGLASVVSVAEGAGLTFSLPVSPDPGVTDKTIYLTTCNGEVLYAALTVANATTSATYAHDTTEVTLPLLTQFLSPPPAGHLVTYFKGRMFVAVGETIYPSEPFAYELFDLRKGITLDGRITLLAGFEDSESSPSGFFVGTDKSCGTMIGADKFSYSKKTDYGAIEGTVSYVDGSLVGDGSRIGALPIWMTAEGVCAGFHSMEVKNLTRTKYVFPATGRGASVFIEGPNKLISTCNL